MEEGIFFIVGVPRSGTTLVRAILSSHPRIVIPPETKFFVRFEPPSTPDGWPAYLDRFYASTEWANQSLDAETFRRRVEATDRTARSVFLTILAMHAERTGKPRVGEKTPHHSRHVERLHQLFPSAKFIFVYRDPRDVIASQLRMPWARWSHLGRARSWVKIMRRAQYLEKIFPADVYTMLRYETLIEQPEVEIRRLCVFLGEAYHKQMLHFDRGKRSEFTEREADLKMKTLRPISNASIGSYASELSARRIAGIERIAGSLLKEFGYEPDRNVGRYRGRWFLQDAADRMCDLFRRACRRVPWRTRVRGVASRYRGRAQDPYC